MTINGHFSILFLHFIFDTFLEPIFKLSSIQNHAIMNNVI